MFSRRGGIEKLSPPVNFCSKTFLPYITFSDEFNSYLPSEYRINCLLPVALFISFESNALGYKIYEEFHQKIEMEMEIDRMLRGYTLIAVLEH